MKFELPPLPYYLDALEPVISERTLSFHYGKHEQTYINNLNGLIIGTPFETMSLEEIVKTSEGAIFNNAAQAWNHIFYFNSFAPNPPKGPKNELKKALEEQWGEVETFKKEFEKAGAGLFGSGWVWLAKKQDGKLEIISKPNAGTPLTEGYTPLLTFDVWEHAYYLDYQNRRADQLKALWEIVNWDAVEARYL